MQHMRQRGQPINPVKPNLPMFADICEDQDNDGKSGSEEERYERSNSEFAFGLFASDWILTSLPTEV